MKHTPRVYIKLPLEPNKTVTLDKNAAHHLVTVLRLKSQSDVIVFNGNGGEYCGKIISIERKQAQIQLTDFFNTSRESPIQIDLLQGVARNDKMDWIIQKAVELGATTFTPVWTEFSNAKIDTEKADKRLAHWQKIIISATEQSGRCQLMQLNPIQRLSDWFTKKNNYDLKLICHPMSERNSATPDKTGSQPIQTACVLIGPEGGLSDNEIKQAAASDFKSLALGPRILRTETAALAALTLIQNNYGDL